MVGDLRAQRTSLKAANRKKEAKYAEDQIRRIEAEAPATCTGCTVVEGKESSIDTSPSSQIADEKPTCRY
jgi:hypothetical protein